jgi:CubicO group peptidase (beta-lactamase class C family)
MTPMLVLRTMLGLCAVLAAVAAPAQRDAGADAIARVERNLLPPLVTERTAPMRLADRMRHYRVPGLSVAVVDKGELAWAHAWGVAQIGKPQPLTPNTLMQAASISKALTGIGATKLVEQGKLTLDADVNSALRTWHVPPGAQTTDNPITLRRLLSHSAGLSTPGFAGYARGQAVPTLTQILDGLPPANSEAVRVTAPPGSAWRYSGGGYVIVQQLMEDVSGQPFADWMQREVLAPAGMSSSLFGALPDAPLSRAAAGHQRGRAIDGLRHTHPEQAAAALWTTPSDLARLTISLQRVLAGESSLLLTQASLAEALRVQSSPSGLGFILEGSGEALRFGHDGSNFGFESRWQADRQRAVIVMANANGAMKLIEEVVRAVAQVQGWTDLQAPRFTTAQLRDSLATTPLFLRGTMNEWDLGAPLKQAAPGRFVAELALAAGPHEFKFAAQDWARIDLGSGEDPRRRDRLAVGGANLELPVKRAGRYRFTLDVRDPAAPRYAVERLPR